MFIEYIKKIAGSGMDARVSADITLILMESLHFY